MPSGLQVRSTHVRSPGLQVAVLALVSFMAVVWGNTLSAPFVFDDHGSILDNSTIRHLWPPDWLKPPATGGETVSGRPVLNLTLALDHAIAGTRVVVYRLTNLLIHLAAGLTLFGIVRRTLAASRADVPASWVALLASMAWTLHPLQTAAVTYVIQRAESLAGLFLFFTLYAFIRAQESVRHANAWKLATLSACILGMATKETVVVAPVILFLYDRFFIGGSFRAAWHARGRLFAALATTWIVPVVLILTNPGRGGSAGLGTSVGVRDYALTQCWSIVHYVRLAFWPAGLVFDHGTPLVTDPAGVWPHAMLLLAALGATVWASVRNHPAGFLGAVFFLTLAPSSSVVPVATQTVAEHRMYVALACLVLLAGGALLAACHRLRRPTPALAASWTVILALATATYARNQVFRTQEQLWRDTARKAPENPRAHYNLALALASSGRGDDAAAEFQRTLQLQPNHAFAHFELGKAALLAGRWAEASASFDRALQADPSFVNARVNLAHALTQAGRPDAALIHYRKALADEPGATDIRTNLAALLIQRGYVDEATALLREVNVAAPGLAEPHYHLGIALTKSGDAARAESEFQRAIQLRPSFAEAQRALAVALAARGSLPGAEAAIREAVRLDDRSAENWFVLGNVLAGQRRIPEATAAFRSAVRLDPTHVPALNNLANCQLVTGRFAEAIVSYETVLQLKPSDASVQENLRLARELQVNRGGRP